MRPFQVPSFRIQIILLVLFLVINSVLFFRNYFLDSFQTYTASVESPETKEKLNRLYQIYGDQFANEEVQTAFKKDVESILVTQQQQGIARDLFRRELSTYSVFIFVFLTGMVLALFFISFNVITQPLRRLQAATEDISRGDWSIQVKESRFSPLNDLIISFNRMTRELERSTQKLVSAEKEMAWREMARVMAHEIKNPLTPIKLSLERLEAKYYTKTTKFDDIFQQTTRVIGEEISNLQKLATEFSRFARLPRADFKPVSIHDLLAEIIAPYEHEIAVTEQPNAEADTVEADSAQLKQALVNLIQNAIQATGESGTVTLSTQNPDDNYIIIAVTDNGPGIEKQDLEKIFHPYFTRKEKGTGLGLPIVKRIVELHQGKITVESTPGSGTTFTLKLPLKLQLK